jgi:hypothetical protein
VDALFHRAHAAFAAGHHEAAAAAYEGLLGVIDTGIDLGQPETYNEVLRTDFDAVGARLMVARYEAAHPDERPDAVWRAWMAAASECSVREPLAAMEGAALRPLPDLGRFLPAWRDRFTRATPKEREAWLFQTALLEVVARVGGADGLRDMALSTGSSSAFSDWVDTLVRRGDHAAAAEACHVASERVARAHDSADFMEKEARVRRAMGQAPEAAAALRRACTLAPTTSRLLRWLVVVDPAGDSLQTRLAELTPDIPLSATDVLIVVRVLRGDYQAVAAMLTVPRAPMRSVAEPREGYWVDVLHDVLGGQPFPAPHAGFAEFEEHAALGVFPIGGESLLPALPAVSLSPFLRLAVRDHPPTEADRLAMLDALRVAVVSRFDDFTSRKRTRHYPEACDLAVKVAETHAMHDQGKSAEEMIHTVRARFPANYGLQRELDRALLRSDHFTRLARTKRQSSP